jgi:AAA ATPase domain
MLGRLSTARIASTSLEHDLSLPFAPGALAVETFIGRERELSGMRDAYTDGPATRKTVVLYGLGGMGKTQLATTYATRYHDQYLAVIWLQGNDENTLHQSFANAAQRLHEEHPNSAAILRIVEEPGAEASAQAMVRWLARGSNTQWLLVFDNVDDPKLPANPHGAYDLTRYIPAVDHGHVLVTTRRSELDIGKCIHVRQLADVRESLDVIASTSKRATTLTGKTRSLHEVLQNRS